MEKCIGTDVNQIEISSLSKIRGQTKVTDLLKVNLDAYFQSRQTGKPSAFGPTLLCGPSGTGKTLTAKALHAELGNLDIIEVNGEMISGSMALIPILLSATENTTIFVDECHSMGSKATNLWLTALSERVVYCSNKNSKTKKAIPLESFCTIMATTHEYCLSDPLRNRFRIYCRFEHYPLDDLVEIIRQRAKHFHHYC